MMYYRSFALLFLLLSGNLMADCSCACWKGGYLSGQFGYFWRNERVKFTNANYFNTLASEILGSKFRFKSNDYLGGVAIGTLYQDTCFVTGYEIGGLFVNHKKTIQSSFFTTDTFSSTLRGIVNAKVRFGIAYHLLCTYICGGWAGGPVELKLIDPLADVVAKKQRWANGWVVGAGVDHKLWGCMSIGVEYNYTHLQYRGQRLRCASCGNGVGLGSPKVNSYHHIQTICLRLNFALC